MFMNDDLAAEPSEFNQLWPEMFAIPSNDIGSPSYERVYVIDVFQYQIR